MLNPNLANQILNGFGTSKKGPVMKHRLMKDMSLNKRMEKESEETEEKEMKKGQPLSFYDMKGKRKFMSGTYKLVKKKVNGRTRTFAVAKAPSGIMSWRIVG